MLNILLILIFIRPFISSLAFPWANLAYSSFLLSFLLLWIIKRGISFKNSASLKLPLTLFSLFLGISVLFSVNKLLSLQELYKYISGIYLLLIASILSSAEKSRIIRVITFAGFVIGILAIYQYFFGFRHSLDYLTKNGLSSSFALDYLQSKRIFFPFVTPNILAGYLAGVLPLALASKNKALFIITLAIALLLTRSVGACLSVFLGLVIYLYLQKKMDKRKIALLFVFLAIAVFIFFLRQATQKQHLQPVFSFAARLNYWKGAFRIILDYPLTGIGIGNFDLMQSRYAHNAYLQLCAEMGLPGLISFAWLIIAVIKTGLKNNNVYKNALLAASAVFLIHNLFDFSFYLPEVSLIWWVTLGLLL